jgi:hypothetical protein
MPEWLRAVDEEMAPLFERLKSQDGAVRDGAVQEFMGVREAISDGLQRAVLESDSGRGTDMGKATAIGLMGQLRLAQCSDVIAAQQGKDWEPRNLHYVVGGRLPFWMEPLETSFMQAQPPKGVSLNPRGAAADLSGYHLLKAALDGLASSTAKPEAGARSGGIINRWYTSIVSPGLGRIMSSSVFPNDTKMAAIWLMGEYRVQKDAMLTYLDIRDDANATKGYPARLAVTGLGSDEEYPAAVALMKAGPLSPRKIIEAVTVRDISQPARERAARLLMLTDPAGARKTLAEKTVAYTAEKDQAVLRSLADIIH